MPLDSMYGGPTLPGHGYGRGDPFNMRGQRPQRPLYEGNDTRIPGRPSHAGYQPKPLMQGGPAQPRPPIDLWAGAGEAPGALGGIGMGAGGSAPGGMQSMAPGVGMLPGLMGNPGADMAGDRFSKWSGLTQPGGFFPSTWNEPYPDNPVMRGMGSLKSMYGGGY